jgi:drug/metabolite transporter (DMT)-like permease
MPGNWKSSSALALTALVGVTAVWGSTFIVVQNAINRMPVMDFLAWRFGIAALIMLVIRPQCLRGMTRQGWLRAALLGAALGLGYIAQTYGLRYTSASVSGFITGMCVVLTPVMSWLVLRRRISRFSWFAVILATLGLGLLSLHGWSFGLWGELLTLACAVFYALHIIGLGEWSAKHDTYGLTLLQLSFVAGICLAAAAPDGLVLPPDGGVWIAVGVTAVLATAVAFFVQTWAQSLVSPTRAAVVLTMEPVFAGIFGVVLGGDRITVQIIAGAACVLAAMYLVQLRSASKAAREAPLQ